MTNLIETSTSSATSDLLIDLRRREVKIHGSEVRLTRLEFELLAHLIKANGAVCGKRDLLRHVWGKIHIEVGAIAKCVSLLRSKLEVRSSHQHEARSSDRYIVTVHRVGYKFNFDRSVSCYA